MCLTASPMAHKAQSIFLTLSCSLCILYTVVSLLAPDLICCVFRCLCFHIIFQLVCPLFSTYLQSPFCHPTSSQQLSPADPSPWGSAFYEFIEHPLFVVIRVLDPIPTREHVGFPPTHQTPKSRTPDGCLTIQLNSDTICRKIPQIKGPVVGDCSLPLQMPVTSHKCRLSSVLLTDRL